MSDAIANCLQNLGAATTEMLNDALTAPWRERALRAEALVREKDEAIGELLEIVDAVPLKHYAQGWHDAEREAHARAVRLGKA